MTPRAALRRLIVCLLPLLSSCGGSRGERAVPKPDAWPRLRLPEAVYAPVHTEAKALTLNTGATLTTERRANALWLTLGYPGFPEGKFYLTLSADETDMASAIDNRMERMSLNSAGLPGTRTELTSVNGWRCIEVLTPASLTTPVQILAAKADSLLSGAFYLQLPPTAAADSVAPAAEAAAADMLELLKAL